MPGPDNMPPLPPEIIAQLRAAELAEREQRKQHNGNRPPEPQQPPIQMVGVAPVPVAANDLRVDANSHEVVLTFALRTATPDDRQLVHETARVMVSWVTMDSILAALQQMQQEAGQFRMDAVREHLEHLEAQTED